jgi:hypothetical protein
LGRFGGPLCQLSHLIGNHREASTLISGAGCLNSGIQGQQIGLVGDSYSNRAGDRC